MQVDRSRFLILTASIAAGCTAPTVNGEIRVATPIEVEPSFGDEPMDSQSTDPSLLEPGDDQTLQAICDSLEAPPGPHCESFYETKEECGTLVVSLEPEAANKAVACVQMRNKTRALCRSDLVANCFVVGTSVAEPEQRLTKRCSRVVKACARNRWRRGKLTMASCGSAMAAVKDRFEDEMISCMSEGCSLARCVWRLR